MKFMCLILAGIVLSFSGCSSFQRAFRDVGAVDHRPLLELPSLDPRRPSPGPREADLSYFASQALLYSELGSRFFKLRDYDTARDFFELALKYDKRNNKALFSLGMLEYQEGNYTEALRHFSNIGPVDQKLFPYDIDYYEVSRMILSQFPLEGRIISLSRNDRTAASERVVVINRGSNHGVQKGMAFNVYRIGNPVRDFETLEVLGLQRTRIAQVVAVDVDQRNTVCEVEFLDKDYFIQINDVIQTVFGGDL